MSSAAIDDYAEGAASALLSPTYDGAVLELSGDTSWSFADLASTFAGVLGREVVLSSLSPDDHRAALLAAGLDEGTAGFVVGRATTPMRETVAAWVR